MSTDLVRVPVPDLDVTYLGLQVMVTGGGESRKGGVSDLHRCVAGTSGCPTAIRSPLLGSSRVAQTHTHVWMGGWAGLLLDTDVVLAPVPPAALEPAV